MFLVIVAIIIIYYCKHVNNMTVVRKKMETQVVARDFAPVYQGESPPVGVPGLPRAAPEAELIQRATRYLNLTGPTCFLFTEATT